MSDLNEGPGELPPELGDFYDAHRDTGEPTGAQLGKALLRVHTETRPVAPMTLSSRRWFPPELLAVAAILVVSVTGAAIGWYTKTQSAAANDEAALAEARKAWAGGNLDSALVALERCTNADCVRLAAAVKRIQTRLRSGEPLPLAAEEGSLLAIERELLGPDFLPKQPATEAEDTDRAFASAQADALLEQGFAPDVVTRAVALFIAGLETSRSTPELATRNFREVVALVPGTALARRAEKRTQPLVGPPAAEPVVEVAPAPSPAPPPDPALSSQLAGLLDQAKAAKTAKRYQSALSLLDRCLALAPDDVECTVTLASTLAAKGTEESSNRDNDRAAALYRRFLQIAAPDDRRIPRVREILGLPAVESAAVDRRDVANLYLRGYQLRESEPDEARRLFEEVVRLSPDSIEGQKAKNRLADLGARSGLGRLRIASNPTRARIFIDGVDTGRETPVLPGSPIEVSPGKHTIYGELDGRRSATTQLNVVEGDNPVIKLLIE